jgi:uncharacterized protein YfaP (DUF2135 family)
MKFKYSKIAMLLAVSSVLGACNSDSNNVEAVSDPTPVEEEARSSVTGYLKDYYTNNAIAQKSVQLSINGVMVDSTMSDENGAFELQFLDTIVFETAIISSDAIGYTEVSKRVTYSETSAENNLYLPPIHAEIIFSASEDSELKVDGETLVSIEANSFVNSDGEFVTGQLTSELFIIDPTNDIDLMPGEMVTASATDPSSEVPIESFGAITATFTTETGEAVQLAEGKTAEIRIPVSGENPPATIPLYYYDNVDGIWVEEGTAILTNIDGVNYYVGEVTHFTTWNADIVYETIYIGGCVVDTDGNAINNARISSEGQDYNGRASAFSDTNGNFSIAAKIESQVFVSANTSQQSRTLSISTDAENISIDECLVLDDATSKIELKWGMDPNDLDSHLYGPDDGDTRFHIAYFNETEVVNGSNIYLDVDDTDSYGPEIITVPEYSLPGIYKYAVHNYSGEASINRSDTRVELILDDQRTLFVPPEGDTKDWWHVFEIEVFEDGTKVLTTVNQWSDAAPEETDSEDFEGEFDVELGEELESIIDEILANQPQSLSTRSSTTFNNIDDVKSSTKATQSKTAASKLTDKYYAK